MLSGRRHTCGRLTGRWGIWLGGAMGWNACSQNWLIPQKHGKVDWCQPTFWEETTCWFWRCQVAKIEGKSWDCGEHSEKGLGNWGDAFCKSRWCPWNKEIHVKSDRLVSPSWRSHRSILASVVSQEQQSEKITIWSSWIETYQIKEVWTWQDFPTSQTIWMFLALDVNTFQWI